MERWNKRNFSLKVEEMVKEDVPVFAGDMNLDRTGKGRDVQDIGVNGVTWINEIGADGNFEVDSNSDGLADGWTSNAVTGTLISKTGYGNYVQQITGDSLNRRLLYFLYGDEDDVYYVSAFIEYISAIAEETYFRFYFYSGSSESLIGNATIEDGRTFVSGIGTLSAGTPFISFKLGAVGDVGEVDGVNVINLTKMGNMPLSLQKYYGKTKFEDLTLTELDALVPTYVNSVQSVGYSFGSEFIPEIIIKNKNIFPENPELVYGFSKSYNSTTGIIEIIESSISSYSKNFAILPDTTYTLSHSGTASRMYLTVLNSDGKGVQNNGVNAKTVTFTTPHDAAIAFLRLQQISNPSPPDQYLIDYEIQLEVGSAITDYVAPKEEKIILPELNSIGYYSDDLYYKRIEHEEITIDTNAGTATSSGTGDCVLVADSDGAIYRGTISGTSVSVTAANGTYQIFYVLTTPIEQDAHINLLSKYLNGEDNNFIGESYNNDTFSGDGSTTAFTLTTTADSTTYDVYVAGIRQDSGVTKTTSGFTFDAAPKNGAIIDAEYNRTTNSSWFATLNVYEPSGTQVTYAAQTTMTVQENQTRIENTDKFGNTDRKIQSRDYTIQLEMDNLKDSQEFMSKWKDKKFRMIIEYTDGTSYEKDIAAVCEIDSSSKNWLTPSESITIRATDYYMGVD